MTEKAWQYDVITNLVGQLRTSGYVVVRSALKVFGAAMGGTVATVLLKPFRADAACPGHSAQARG